jgi:hypothetical protein
MNSVQIAMANLDSATAHRARIGAYLKAPRVSSMLLDWYDDALAIENAKREELGAAISKRDAEWDYAAYRA